MEGLVVLAWALGLAEIPAHDQLVDTDQLLDALSLLDVPMCQSKIATAELRSMDELETKKEQIWAFNWRMVQNRVCPGEPVDYANVDFGWGKLDCSWATLVDGDLALQGVAISQADPEVVSQAVSTAVERHIAVNWLCGQENLYSDISPHT